MNYVLILIAFFLLYKKLSEIGEKGGDSETPPEQPSDITWDDFSRQRPDAEFQLGAGVKIPIVGWWIDKAIITQKITVLPNSFSTDIPNPALQKFTVGYNKTSTAIKVWGKIKFYGGVEFDLPYRTITAEELLNKSGQSEWARKLKEGINIIEGDNYHIWYKLSLF